MSEQSVSENGLLRSNGVLPSQWIRGAIESGIVHSEARINADQIQPNSLDLRLGSFGHRVQCSLLPGPEGFAEKLGRFSWYTFDLPDEGIVLDRNHVYVFPISEELKLPENVYAYANPKSTTGRLDVFTRLVTEHGTAFDTVPKGYRGRLYLEVVPRSFAIRARAGDSLAQIRFQIGDPRLTRDETVNLLNSEHVVLGRDQATLRAHDLDVQSGLVLSISLPKNDKIVGYQARRNTPPIDLRAVGKSSKRNYWDRIHGDSKPVILEPDEFYIFASRELVRLPPQYCAEMVAFNASSGEVRTHYAGFFDSGFGYSPSISPEFSAAAVVLEVRSRDVPFLIEDGQPLFRVNILRCTEVPDIVYGAGLGSNYQGQRLRLSKQFNASLDSFQDEEDGGERSQQRMEF